MASTVMKKGRGGGRGGAAPATVNKSASARAVTGQQAQQAQVAFAQSLPDVTVEEYLQMQCDQIVADLQQHSEAAQKKLREEYEVGRREIVEALHSSKAEAQRVRVEIDITSGPHQGSQHTLVSRSRTGTDLFKIGRSRGRHFQTRGISLFRDDSVSTTHAKVEIKHGKVFVTDTQSTNGTLLNGDELEPDAPVKLESNDVLVLGDTTMRITVVEDGPGGVDDTV